MLVGNPITALAWSARICATGLMLQSLELLSEWRELPAGRLLGWRGPANRSPEGGRGLWPPFGFSATLLVLIGRTAAAAGVLWMDRGAAWVSLLAILLVTQFYHLRRFQRVLTNADHMNLVVLAGSTTGVLMRASPVLPALALIFVLFHVLWAYAASGFEKLRSAGWRDGSRITEVFQDSAYRFEPLGAWFAAKPGCASFVSWMIIAGEMLFPFALLVPGRAFLAVLALGLLFHLMIGVLMSLPTFFWAFAATYPVLYFVHIRLAGVLR